MVNSNHVELLCPSGMYWICRHSYGFDKTTVDTRHIHNQNIIPPNSQLTRWFNIVQGSLSILLKIPHNNSISNRSKCLGGPIPYTPKQKWFNGWKFCGKKSNDYYYYKF